MLQFDVLVDELVVNLVGLCQVDSQIFRTSQLSLVCKHCARSEKAHTGYLADAVDWLIVLRTNEISNPCTYEMIEHPRVSKRSAE